MDPAVSSKNPVDYFILLVTSLTAGSIFLPWFQIEITTTFEGYATHNPYGSFRGTFVEGGWVGLSLALFSMILLFLRVRWSFWGGICNFLVGLSYLLGWVDLSKKFLPPQTTNALVHVEPLTGLYLFIVSSLVSTLLIIRTHYASRVF